MMMQILPIISDDKVTSSHLLFTLDASHIVKDINIDAKTRTN